MATFENKVYQLRIEDHSNADALELAVVGEYRAIVLKDQYKNGSLGVYIPEGAVLPDWLIASLGLEGRLAGKQRNRVKAIKLRGVLSQGLIVPVWDDPISGDKYVQGELECDREFVGVGDDLTEFLGITKYEPPIPTHMAGEVFNAFGKTMKYDIENFKRFPEVLNVGEEVIMTEKLHGTWCCFGYHPEIEHPIVSSKGISDKGLAFKFNEANKFNLYLRALDASKNDDGDDYVTAYRRINPELTPFYILGEVYGAGVQDLTYGQTTTVFNAFDVYIGEPGTGYYLSYDDLVEFCETLNIPMVPLLYRGPWCKAIQDEHTDGPTTINGSHIREGIVIRPTFERRDDELGRVQLKSVSEKYLLRKNKNATEYS